ncbi:Vms1/Ankzf1 family peptidyl-tRNA hydrolase [Streptomyces megasporus]|uniref:baeRF2 domain-containing protein n=1 Tax=Streptomyces megasporus TaxID=44060 RepID=UPI00068C1597|nr:Vms1/Ankzf1 family peptidyl-tRNA hydrolase [Streptomyces megasporus]
MELGFLSPILDRPGLWASVYFDIPLATEDAATRHELGARDVCEQLASRGADDRTCRAVYETLVALPRTAHPSGQAVFATGGEVVLTRDLAAPPPGGAYAGWGPLPHVTPLLDLMDTAPPCLVARMDRTGADLELRGPFGTREVGHVQGEEHPLHMTPSLSWRERHFQNSVENTWDHNAALIAEELRRRHAETNAELVVLAGDGRECHAVRDRLAPELREVAVLAEHGVRDAGRNQARSERLLDEEVESARAERLRRHTAEVMERFQARRVPTDDGRVGAAEGVPALVDAAREHRIDTLLIRPDGPDLHREVWVGDEPDQVAVRRSDARRPGRSQPVSARADDALLRAAVATGAEVVSVAPLADEPGTPDGLPVGGLGALLRWPYGGPPAEGSTGGQPPTA